VGHEVNPDGNLGTGIDDIEAEKLQTGRDDNVGAETEAELNLNGGGQVNVGTNTDGQSLGKDIVQLAGVDLLGQDGDVDVVSLLEGQVDASRQVNSSTNTDNKVEGESSSQSQLKKTGIDLEVGGGNELHGLVDGGVSGDVDGDVSLQTSKVEADDLLGGEVLESLEVDLALDFDLTDVKVQVDGGIGGSIDSGNTIPM
jgi:hypothetical protein